MYAKTLVPGPHPIPALMATTDEATVLLPQLIDRGWAHLGDPAPPNPAGFLRIGTDRLQLVVDDQALLDDFNPYAPHGWWAAVDTQHQRCLVVVAAEGDVDLTANDAGRQLTALMGTDRDFFAVLPVITTLDN